MDNSKALAPGSILQSPSRTYTIRSVLGRGGFGITYSATYSVVVGGLPVKAIVAIKEHFISEMCDREASTSQVMYSRPVAERVEASRRDFIAEARRLSQVSQGQENIVKVSEVFEANDTAYYVMEYLEGQSFKEYVTARGALSLDETLAIMLPIISAVGHLHRGLMTHLDIKPANIMITRDENGRIRPVLIDFGLCKHYNEDGSATSTINTQGFSDGFAPIEQYAGISQFSPQSDVYSLAATIMYCLTGQVPPRATDLDAEAVIPASLPTNIRQTLDKALQMRRNDRPANAQVFLEHLLAKNAAPQVPSQPYSERHNPPQPCIYGGHTDPIKDDDSTKLTNDDSTQLTGDDSTQLQGSSDDSSEIPPVDPPTDDDSEDDIEVPRKSRTAIYIIGALLIAVILGVGAYFLFSDNNSVQNQYISYTFTNYSKPYGQDVTNVVLLAKDNSNNDINAVWCLRDYSGEYLLPIAIGNWGGDNVDSNIKISLYSTNGGNSENVLFNNGEGYDINVNPSGSTAQFNVNPLQDSENYFTEISGWGNTYDRGENYELSDLLVGNTYVNTETDEYGTSTLTIKFDSRYTCTTSFISSDGYSKTRVVNYILLSDGHLAITSGDNLINEFTVAYISDMNSIPFSITIRQGAVTEETDNREYTVTLVE